MKPDDFAEAQEYYEAKKRSDSVYPGVDTYGTIILGDLINAVGEAQRMPLTQEDLEAAWRAIGVAQAECQSTPAMDRLYGRLTEFFEGGEA